MHPLIRSVGRLLPSPLKHRLARRLARLRHVPAIRLTDPGSIHASPFESCVAIPNLLTELGSKFKPTKRYHNYLPYYWLHFRDIREHVRTVVEIGVETDRSVRMWEEFFPGATIYGIDINPVCKAYESGRVKILIGDQSDTSFLDDCLREIGRAPDIVIDDGSHRPEHQIATFNFLLPRLSDHGIYVVEDTGGVVDDIELRTVRRLARLVRDIFYWPNDPAAHWTTLDRFTSAAPWSAHNVTGLAFYRSIVFVMRGHNPAENAFLSLSAETIDREGLAPLR